MHAGFAVRRRHLSPLPNRDGVRYRSGVRTEVPPGHGGLDQQVEAAWSAGDESSLQQAYECFGSLVFTYCARALGDRELAAECTQDTFVSAWRSRDRFDPTLGSLAGWLLGIARFRVIDTQRRGRKVASPLGEVPEVADGTDHTDEVAHQLLVARALESLPERARQVVELAFYSQLSHSEMADRLQLPLGTVKSDVRRALTQLRAALGGEFDERER